MPPYDLNKNVWDKALRYSRVVVRWLPHFSIGLIAIIYFAHRLYPSIIDWLGHLLNLSAIQATTIVTLIIVVFILERIDSLTRMRESSISIYDDREEAYKYLSDQLRAKRVAKVDMIQFSGYTAQQLLSALAVSSAKAQVRILLAAQEITDEFDVDLSSRFHEERKEAVRGQIKVLTETSNIHVDLQYYDTPASVSAVLVDDEIVAISWYHAYRDGSFRRMRGHQAPTIIATGKAGNALRWFAREQFKKLWSPADGPL